MIGGRRPRAERTLRGRVALVATLVLGVWASVLTALVNLVLVARLGSQADGVLNVRAESAAATIQLTPGGRPVIRDPTDDATLDATTWIFIGSTLRERPPDQERYTAEVTALARSDRPVYRTERGTGLRWHVQPVRIDGRPVGTVVTSISLKPYRATDRMIVAATGTLALLMLASVYVGLRAAVGRALRPVAEMTHRAARWSSDGADLRFGPARRPAELADLALTLDAVLDRLSAVLRHEKQLSLEVSHELRTPVARVLVEAELLRGPARAALALDTGLATIQRSAEEMTEILEILMRSAGPSSATLLGRCDPVQVLDRVLAVRRRIGIGVAVRAERVMSVDIDAAVLHRVLGPVIDNALRFATSRVEISVLPTVRDGRSMVLIAVHDDGAGFAAGDAERAFEPGYRGADPHGHPGAGLGLALTRRLVAGLGGEVFVGDARDGAEVVVCVPGQPVDDVLRTFSDRGPEAGGATDTPRSP